MADGEAAPHSTAADADGHGDGPSIATDKPAAEQLQQPMSPLSPRPDVQNPYSRRQTSFDLDDYFTGPRDMQRFSKWPVVLQMHGSILPSLILPLLIVGAWATCITCISEFTRHTLGINSVLLTVTGFVVAFSLSLRSTTAYERYAEGRKYWAQLLMACQCLGRVFWVHVKIRDGVNRERDILSKLSAMNLLVAFSVALKHKLRFEPYTGYDDITHLVAHLDTFAREATLDDPDLTRPKKTGRVRSGAQMLGLTFAQSNPRKAIKKAARPLGNLPLEILSYLGSFTDECVANGQLPVPMTQTLAYNNIAALNDVLTGTERVLNTPLPIAYAIAINQITWLYVILLPFQLYTPLKWITIPASVVAAYIILGILFIGREIENPFGNDVNDLPLDAFCAQVASEMDIIAARPPASGRHWIDNPDNKVLFPLSSSGFPAWLYRGEAEVRAALKAKTEMSFESKKSAAEPGRAGTNGPEAVWTSAGDLEFARLGAKARVLSGRGVTKYRTDHSAHSEV